MSQFRCWLVSGGSGGTSTDDDNDDQVVRQQLVLQQEPGKKSSYHLVVNNNNNNNNNDNDDENDDDDASSTAKKPLLEFASPACIEIAYCCSNNPTTDGALPLFFLGGFQLVTNAKHCEVYLTTTSSTSSVTSEAYLTTSRGIPFERGVDSQQPQPLCKAMCVVPGGPRPIHKLRIKLLGLLPSTNDVDATLPVAILHSLKLTARVQEAGLPVTPSPVKRSQAAAAAAATHHASSGPALNPFAMSSAASNSNDNRAPPSSSEPQITAAMAGISMMAHSTQMAMKDHVTQQLHQLDQAWMMRWNQTHQQIGQLTMLVMTQKTQLEQQLLTLRDQQATIQQQQAQLLQLLSPQPQEATTQNTTTGSACTNYPVHGSLSRDQMGNGSARPTPSTPVADIPSHEDPIEIALIEDDNVAEEDEPLTNPQDTLISDREIEPLLQEPTPLIILAEKGDLLLGRSTSASTAGMSTGSDNDRTNNLEMPSPSAQETADLDVEEPPMPQIEVEWLESVCRPDQEPPPNPLVPGIETANQTPSNNNVRSDLPPFHLQNNTDEGRNDYGIEDDREEVLSAGTIEVELLEETETSRSEVILEQSPTDANERSPPEHPAVGQ